MKKTKISPKKIWQELPNKEENNDENDLHEI